MIFHPFNEINKSIANENDHQKDISIHTGCFAYFGEMELQRIISWQGDAKASCEILRKRISMIIQEQRVIW